MKKLVLVAAMLLPTAGTAIAEGECSPNYPTKALAESVVAFYRTGETPPEPWTHVQNIIFVASGLKGNTLRFESKVKVTDAGFKVCTG